MLPGNEERRQQLEAIAQKIRLAGVEFVLFPEPAVVAGHAIGQGWIAEVARSAIRPDQGV